jgi:polyisoprenyl-teichoic acid--peptidoglycan teichoic acid transferase
VNARLRPALIIIIFAVVAFLVWSSVQGLRSGDEPGAGGSEMVIPDREALRVEVLNASEISGLARRGTQQLRARGFDVVYYGNASGFSPESSVVIARAGNEAAADSVADALGLRSVRVEADSTLYLDVTVVLGRDWEAEETEP